MLVSLRGVRINSVLSFFFLKQVSSDLLHVWVLVCCVFNFAVDCIWDYCPVVLFSSLCWGMTHKIHVNSVMKTVRRIHNLGQKLFRIILYWQDAYQAGLVQLHPVWPPLTQPVSMLYSQGQKWSSRTSTLFFGGRGKKEVPIMSSTIVCLRALTVTSIFLNIFVQDCRIDLVCVTFFFLLVLQCQLSE